MNSLMIYDFFQQFDSPVVSIWRDNYDSDSGNWKLKEINLFNHAQMNYDPSSNPSIYFAMYKSQLYVQENPSDDELDHSSTKHIDSAYHWQPYPAIGTGQ